MTGFADLFAGQTADVLPLPGQWTFHAERIVSRARLGPVQPVAFSYTVKLNGFGTGTATLAVDQLPLTRADLTRLWSWRLWAFYAGRPVWCGAPTGVADEGKATVTVTFTEISGYLTKRQYDTTGRYQQVEQTQIARDLAAPLADVGVGIITDPGPGFRRDRSYEYLEGQNRAELLSNLSNVIDGPEFRCEYSLGADAQPQPTLRIAYPRVGAGASSLALIVPGSALTFRVGWDADNLRTRTFSVGDLPEGAPEGTPKPVVVVDRPQPDLPRLDEADSWPGVVLTSTLDERARTNASVYAAPTVAASGSTFESAPPLGSYGVGDDVQINLTDPLLAGGYAFTGRLTEIAVDAATGKVTWTVGVRLPAAQPRQSLTGRIARLDSVTTAMFRRNVDSGNARLLT